MKSTTLLLTSTLLIAAGCRYEPRVVDPSPSVDRGNQCSRVFALSSPCLSAPANAETLYSTGKYSLVAGETESDIAANMKRDEGDCDYRNSLFVKRTKANGDEEWRLLLTTGSDWGCAEGMDEWGTRWARDAKRCFQVIKAVLSPDGRHIWLVCNPHTGFFSIVCSYDCIDNTFRVLIDGDTAEEQPDGTLLVRGKKSYPYPDDGLGAIWRDVWITPDGKIVREGKITMRGSDF